MTNQSPNRYYTNKYMLQLIYNYLSIYVYILELSHPHEIPHVWSVESRAEVRCAATCAKTSGEADKLTPLLHIHF